MAPAACEEDDAFGLLNREQAENKLVDEGEYGSVRSDSEGERGYRD
jgi:hypothetical protein